MFGVVGTDNCGFPVQPLNLKFCHHGFNFSIKSSYVPCHFQIMKLLTILWHVSFKLILM